ncbi:MAG: N-acetylmuramoyl-L-alanine amidase AmiB [Wenzhouxiangellaceae bacterium]
MLLAVVACLAQATEVRNVRVWAGPDKTRVVLDLDQESTHTVFTLDDPDRVVIDLPGSRTGLDAVIEPDNGGVLKRVRHGIRHQQDLRVVLDLEQPVKVQSFLLPPTGSYGHRLVIDLFPRQAAAAASTPVPAPVQPSPVEDRDMIVAIDAGHGGEDPGAIGPAGSMEKHIVLAIARELARQVDEIPGMRALLIRDGDYYIPLKERYEQARKARADLFVSIHADAFRDRSVRGSSVFILSRRGASSEAARLLAQSENAADLIGGVQLSDGDEMLRSVLLDLSQSASLDYSRKAASRILRELADVGKTHRREVESANFVVLRSPDVPSVLIETGFISNPSDEANLGSPRYRKRLASAILRGIEDHFRQTAPAGTLFATQRKAPGRYVVQRGDTLGDIAARHAVSVQRLRQANRLEGDVIHPGAVLVIPTG